MASSKFLEKMEKNQSQLIYQIKISLNGISPSIWRTVLVRSDLTLTDFHFIIQIVMGWNCKHLHQFITNNTYYGTIALEDIDDLEDENTYIISQLMQKEGDSIIYEYDFGDSWKHTIILEKILPHNISVNPVICIKGQRACPKEDCGGAFNYEELIKIISNTKHPRYEESHEWLDEEKFDPEKFNIEEINKQLAKLC